MHGATSIKCRAIDGATKALQRIRIEGSRHLPRTHHIFGARRRSSTRSPRLVLKSSDDDTSNTDQVKKLPGQYDFGDNYVWGADGIRQKNSAMEAFAKDAPWESAVEAFWTKAGASPMQVDCTNCTSVEIHVSASQMIKLVNVGAKWAKPGPLTTMYRDPQLLSHAFNTLQTFMPGAQLLLMLHSEPKVSNNVTILRALPPERQLDAKAVESFLFLRGVFTSWDLKRLSLLLVCATGDALRTGSSESHAVGHSRINLECTHQPPLLLALLTPLRLAIAHGKSLGVCLSSHLVALLHQAASRTEQRAT
eukprot:8235796-Pyramimonas_sp.AAC.2